MKKIWIPIVAILLAVAVLGGALIYLLIAVPRVTSQPEEPTLPEFRSVEDYIATDWKDYRFVRLQNDVLTLEYDLSGSFEQLQKHGVAAGFDAVAAGNLDTAMLIIKGCNMQCDVVLREVVVLGISSDGQQAYRASTADGITACWDEA